MEDRKRPFNETLASGAFNDVLVETSRTINTRRRIYTVTHGGDPSLASSPTIGDAKPNSAHLKSPMVTEQVPSNETTIKVARRPPAKRQRRSKWTQQDDECLVATVHKKTKGRPGTASTGTWAQIADELDNGRNAKQCRDRWQNYLRPGIKKGQWTRHEEELIHDMYANFGPRWSAMAKMFPHRTDNDIKNKWYSMARTRERMSAKLGFPVSDVKKSMSTSTTLKTPTPQKKEPTPFHLGQQAASARHTEQHLKDEAEADFVASIATEALIAFHCQTPISDQQETPVFFRGSSSQESQG